MHNSPSIRQYDARDLEACRALWAELTQSHRELYADPTIGGDDPGRAFDAHLAAVGSERIWVADSHGRVVGLAGLILRGSKAELEPVVVAAAYRGRGIGRSLAAAVTEAARGAGAHQVAVRPVGRNVAAIRFFHALGFDVLGRLDLRLDLEPKNRPLGAKVDDLAFRV